MKILFKITQKNIILILLLGLNISVFTQKVQTGIYEVIYNTDTTFIHQNIKKLNPQDYYKDTKYVYDYNYTNFIDPIYKIKYAVIISDEDPNKKGHFDLNMLWLNATIPKDYNISFSDNSIRKYIHYATSIYKTIVDYAWNNDKKYENEQLFLAYNNPKNEFKDAYGDNFGKFDDNTIFVNREYLFMKSSNYNPVVNRVVVDSSSYYDGSPLYGKGFRKSTQYATINQPIATFKLKTLKNYNRYLSIQRDNVTFYSNGKIKMLNKGDFIAITKETDEYYYGENVSVDGEVTAGRIFIDDLTIEDGLKISKMNGIILKTKYNLFEETQGWNQSGEILSIKTYYKNKIIQVIKNAGFVSDTTSVLDFDDVNFDGLKDLVVFAHDGGSGPNFGNNYYIFNPKTKQFVYNETMSDLTQPEVNSKTKTVNAAWRNGAANHGSETYKWIKNKLTMVESYETNFTDENNPTETHKFLINGKMRGKTKKLK